MNKSGLFVTRTRWFRSLLLAGTAALSQACMAAGDDAEFDQVPAEELATREQALRGGSQAWAKVRADGSVEPGLVLGSPTVTQPSPGQYVVKFPGVGGAGGTAQVVAAGSTNNRCKLLGFAPSGTDEQIVVACTTPAGQFTPNGFVVYYGREAGAASGPAAYVFANQPSVASYTPAGPTNWNSTGGANSITRLAVGAYEVTLPGLIAAGGTVQVTAHDANSTYCNVQQPWFVTNNAMKVRVRCYGPWGSSQDARFTLNYFIGAGTPLYDNGAYALAHQPTTASYVPASTFSHNSPSCLSAHPTNLAGRSAQGLYTMRHSHRPVGRTAVHVTAVASAGNYCNVEGWTASGSDVLVRTRCFNAAGAPTDSMYVESLSGVSFGCAQ